MTLFPVILVVSIVTMLGLFCSVGKSEYFTLPSPRPSEWFLPQPYVVSDWLVRMNQDRLSQPECLSYNRGDPGVLNFNGSSYRFMRF